MRLNRLLASAAFAAMAATSAAAQTPPQNQPVEVVIDQGVLRPYQIAVVDFAGENGADLSGVIRADLRRSGYF